MLRWAGYARRTMDALASRRMALTGADDPPQHPYPGPLPFRASAYEVASAQDLASDCRPVLQADVVQQPHGTNPGGDNEACVGDDDIGGYE